MKLRSFNNGSIFSYDRKSYYDTSGNIINTFPLLKEDVFETVCADMCKVFVPPLDCGYFLDMDRETVTCEYNIGGFNPNTSIENSLAVEFPVDSVSSTATLNIVISSPCEDGPVYTETVVKTHYNFTALGNNNNSLFVDGAYADVLRVYRSDTNTAVDLDISPTGTNLTGVHIVNAADLVLNTASPALFAPTVKKVIENAIFNQIGAAAGYFLTVAYNNTTRKLTIFFRNKNVPATLWVGVNTANPLFSYYYDGVILESTILPTSSTSANTGLTYEKTISCVDFRYSGSYGQAFIANYNSVVYTSPNTVITLNGTSVLSGECGVQDTLSFVTDCDSYSGVKWKKDGIIISTSETVEYMGAGEYEVMCICSDGCILSTSTNYS